MFVCRRFDVVMQLRQKETGNVQCHNVTGSARNLPRWRALYREHPVLDEDFTRLITIAVYLTNHCTVSELLPSRHLFHLWFIADLTMNESTLFRDARVFSRHVFSASMPEISSIK